MKNSTKRLHRQLLSLAAFLIVTIFIMGCSSTTRLSSIDVKMKGLRLVKATPKKINPIKRQANDVVVASSRTRLFTTKTETSQPTVTTSSSCNEVVISSTSQNKIQTLSLPVDKDVIEVPQNVQSTAKVAEIKAPATKVRSAKPKGNKTKMILLGLLAYITLGGAMATAKHINDTKKDKATYGGGCKSWIAAVLLCFFLGGLGIHRFYLGYTWQGIVQLLTGGGCGVWALIDFIRILIKDLNPKDGDYC